MYVPCSFFGLYTNILYKYGNNSCSFTYLLSICENKWQVYSWNKRRFVSDYRVDISKWGSAAIIRRQSLTSDILREKCGFITGNYGNVSSARPHTFPTNVQWLGNSPSNKWSKICTKPVKYDPLLMSIDILKGYSEERTIDQLY